MDNLHYLLNFILHLDVQLYSFVSTYGLWVYGLLFLIIFCETGLIIMAFLPGDSLLFAAGAIAAGTPDLNIHLLFVLLVIASILGNSLNYLLGKKIGGKLFASSESRLFNRKYLEQAHLFYERFGGKTIIIARFLPIIRTFAPFAAGMGYMTFKRFQFFNITGAVLWIGSLLYLSYWFGNLPIVKDHFSFVIIGIIGLSLIPPVIEMGRRKFYKENT